MATRSEKPGQTEQQNAPKTGTLTQRRGGMTPYSPFGSPFRRIREEFDQLFDQFFGGMPAFTDGNRDWRWGFDMDENDNAVVVRAEVPGFEPDEFDVQVRGDQLIVRATHKAETEEKEGGFREWQRHEFHRVVTLPATVDAEQVDAAYRNGVLSITLPKTEEMKARRITVKS